MQQGLLVYVRGSVWGRGRGGRRGGVKEGEGWLEHMGGGEGGPREEAGK